MKYFFVARGEPFSDPMIAELIRKYPICVGYVGSDRKIEVSVIGGIRETKTMNAVETHLKEKRFDFQSVVIV